MKHNLMAKEKLENLGYTAANSYENEEQRKQDLYRKLVEVDKMAERNIYRMQGKTVDNNVY